MSSIDRLAIRGIRSFDMNEMNVIQFFHPLTVIVGHNGSGKTTIIECLKYATTGDLPPNTKGGAFVLDPNIAMTSEVRGHVKLRFQNQQKEKVIVERRLQVSKKKGGAPGLTMKTLEATMAWVDAKDKDKARRTLSSKNAELDTEVPKQLGTSKAVLENVIFCHQEDSNWPLAEPAALKKKFDEIFEATKYTKALDHMRSLKKDMTNDNKVEAAKLAGTKNDVERADKLRRAIEKLASLIDDKEVEYSAMEEEIKQIGEKNKEFYEKATKVNEIINRADTIEQKKKWAEENIRSLCENLVELKDTDEELKDKIDNYERDLSKANGRKHELQEQYSEARDALTQQESRRSQCQRTIGILIAATERFEKLVDTRSRLIHEISARHEIRGFEHELSDDEMVEFSNRLEELIVSQGNAVTTIKREARESENKKSDEIQSLRAAQAAEERTKRAANDQIRKLQSDMSTFDRTLESSTISQADVSLLRANIESDTNRKATAEERLATAKYAERLRDKTSELKRAEEDRDAVHAQLAALNRQSDERARLGLKKTDMQRKSDAIKTHIDGCQAKFVKYTKESATAETMEQQLGIVTKEFDRDLAVAEKEATAASRKLQEVEMKVDLAKRKLADAKSREKSFAAQRNTVFQQCQIDASKQLATVIAETQAEVDLCHRNLNGEASILEFYKANLTSCANGGLCSGCGRGMPASDRSAIEKHIQAMLLKLPQDVKQDREDLPMWQEQLAALRGLVSNEEKLQQIRTKELPEVKKDLEGLTESQLPNAMEGSETTSTKVRKLKDGLSELQQLRKVAVDVSRLHREREQLAREVSRLEDDLKETGTLDTVEDVQQKLNALGVTITRLRKDMDTLRGDESKEKTAIQQLERAIYSSTSALHKREQELRDLADVEKKKEDSRAEVERLYAEIKEIDTRLKNTQAPHAKLQQELTALRSEFSEKEAVASRELAAFTKSQDQLAANEDEINHYKSSDTSSKLKRSETELKEADLQIKDTKDSMADCASSIAKIEKDLAESKGKQRNLRDNVSLRTARRELKAHEAELAALDVASAKKASRKYTSEWNEKRQEHVRLQSTQARLGGEIETCKKDLRDKKEEMKSEYDKVDERYSYELVSLKVAEMAVRDLEKYAKALDAAIMAFHGEKMQEINDTIQDLWQKVYQGTDIDRIMIKSDAEGKVGGRSYNYRVVMVKDSVEMDMRGRCSAGQKVLASILIRLALAESFGVNCGVLALDEPTTNLDSANVTALAQALCDIIHERKGQANFQLILITHDEDFLQALNNMDVVERYWRVVRNKHGGMLSSIEREKI